MDPREIPLAEAPLAFLDLEMTARDPAVGRVCEIAIHRVVGGRVIARWQSLVAGAEVGASRSVHGIDDTMLAGAPPLAALRPALARLLAGAVVVGHAVAFDLAFLAAAHARGEIDAPPAEALDTRALAQRALRSGSASLASLARDLGLPAPSHRAEPDVIATRALFDAVCAMLRPRTARDLFLAQDLAGRATLRDDVGELLRGGIASGRAVRVCYRVPGRDAFVDELDVWSLEPPHVEGWLHGKKVRRALRGDRILWAEPTDRPAARARPEGYTPCIARA
jgi:DNA polymerase-3 subunit epsilon